MTPIKVRLAFAPFFRLATLILVIAGELALVTLAWGRFDPATPLFDRLAILGFLSVSVVLMPAIPVACLLTIAADLAVVFLVRPALFARNAPRVDAGRSAFHLGAGESVLASTPARRVGRRAGAAGALVLTDRRVWFFPADWGVVPWSAGLDEVRSIRPVEHPRSFGGLIRGLPDRVAVEAGAPPASEAFAVPDPGGVSSWPRPAVPPATRRFAR